MLDWLYDRVDALRPDTVLFDSEYYRHPDIQHKAITGIVGGCNYCAGSIGAMIAWRDMAREWRNVVYSICPDAEVRWYDDPTDEGETTFWPAGVGDVPVTAFYKACKHEHPVLMLRKMLRANDVRRGYPHLSALVDPWQPNSHETIHPRTFGDMCRVLKDAGAAGFSFYPGPVAVGNNWRGGHNDENFFRAIEAGARAFR